METGIGRKAHCPVCLVLISRLVCSPCARPPAGRPRGGEAGGPEAAGAGERGGAPAGGAAGKGASPREVRSEERTADSGDRSLRLSPIAMLFTIQSSQSFSRHSILGELFEFARYG